MGYPAVKLFLYFRLLREHSRASYPDNYAWIRCGQDTILNATGIKSKSTFLSARLELAELGWIADYKRGGYNHLKENTTNRYCIMDSKLKNPNLVLIKAWGGVVDAPEEGIKKSRYIVGISNLRDELERL